MGLGPGASATRMRCYLRTRLAALAVPPGEVAWIPDEVGVSGGASSIAAFWLRRGLDETHDEVWAGVAKVLRLYDPVTRDELQRLFPAAGVAW